MNQVSELIIAKNSLVSISSTEGGSFNNQGFHEQIEYLERITTNLHESVMKVRMVTAKPRPKEVFTFLDTAKYEHIPRK